MLYSSETHNIDSMVCSLGDVSDVGQLQSTQLWGCFEVWHFPVLVPGHLHSAVSHRRLRYSKRVVTMTPDRSVHVAAAAGKFAQIWRVDMLCTVDELGTGRLRLSLNYIKANSIKYGQPIIVEQEDSGELQGRHQQQQQQQQQQQEPEQAMAPATLNPCVFAGVKQRFLCTASVASPASAAAFDPSVQCGLHTVPLPCSRGSQLLLSLKPVSSKVITAASVKVGAGPAAGQQQQ
jgi:hypothetical protein